MIKDPFLLLMLKPHVGFREDLMQPAFSRTVTNFKKTIPYRNISPLLHV